MRDTADAQATRICSNRAMSEPSAVVDLLNGLLGVYWTAAAQHQTHAALWRARLTGLSRAEALKACASLAHSRKSCIVLSPEAQS